MLHVLISRPLVGVCFSDSRAMEKSFNSKILPVGKNFNLSDFHNFGSIVSFLPNIHPYI